MTVLSRRDKLRGDTRFLEGALLLRVARASLTLLGERTNLSRVKLLEHLEKLN